MTDAASLSSPSPPASPDVPANGTGPGLPTEILDQLRDVELAPAAPWWPPAPGYWVLLLLGLIAATGVWVGFRRRNARLAGKKQLGESLRALAADWQASPPSEASARRYAQGANALLRRTAIRYAGRDAAAPLTGAAFVRCLNRFSDTPIGEHTADRLRAASDQPGAAKALDIDAIDAELRAWQAGLQPLGDEQHA